MLKTNEVYNMDCMEGIKLLDDNSIDLVVIDPPYLLNLTKVKKTSSIINLMLLKKTMVLKMISEKHLNF